MINRILIRLKVVQLLYSYLLTRNDFTIAEAPEGESKEKKYSYKIYLQLIDAIVRMSGLTAGRNAAVMNPDRVLEKNSLARELLSIQKIRGALLNTELYTPLPVDLLGRLADEITESAAFKEYKKTRSKSLEDDVKFWTTIVETTLANNQKILSFDRKDEDFSLSAFARAIVWLNGTLSSYCDTKMSYTKALKELERSLDSAYHLYISIFQLIRAITREEENRLETNKIKHLATAADLNPDMRFVENRVIKAIDNCEEFNKYVNDHPVDLDDDPHLVRSLLDLVLQSEIYKDYMAQEETTLEDDCELWRNLLRYVILPSDDLAEALETKSLYWNDDLHIMGTFAIKTIKRVATNPDEAFVILDKYKDEEDARLGRRLFESAVLNRITYRDYIDRFINTENWDAERIPFMDFVIMTAAIAELINFPEIAVAVTMNEYVEIANYYSTERSGKFVNGVLYAVYSMLREQGVIQK